MPENPAKLEQLLGHRFQNPELLKRALTHRSAAHEQKPAGDEETIRALQNESLEFVGDAVLGLAVAEYLYQNHPGATEGDLSLMKHLLVSKPTLAKTARRINLGAFLRVGRGEEKTGGRRKNALLADAFEAVLAAIFFDGGYAAARSFVRRILADELKRATPVSSLDYKTLLQETLQSSKREAPTYRVVKTEGPPHKRTFFVEVAWDADSATGDGTSIKAAEMKAASLALKKIEAENGAA